MTESESGRPREPHTNEGGERREEPPMKVIRLEDLKETVDSLVQQALEKAAVSPAVTAPTNPTLTPPTALARDGKPTA